MAAAEHMHTVQEAAVLLSTHPMTVYRRIWSNELAAVDIAPQGSKRARLRVPDSALAAYEASKPVGRAA
jgi:excisionase family DNA binding protein